MIKKIISNFHLEPSHYYSFVEVCDVCRISEEVLIEILEHGIFNHHMVEIREMKFSNDMISRLQIICRLQQDLDLNTTGAILILELQDELRLLKDKLAILERHIDF